jgi:hypothetical protein
MPSHNSIYVICCQCSKSVLKYWAHTKGRKNLFCSVECCNAFRTRSIMQHVEAKTVRMGSCLIWIGNRDKDGYGRLETMGRLPRRVHRAVWEHHFGKIPDDLVIRHTCDNPPCCEITHLIPGTTDQNNKDCISRDRNSYGENHYKTILTNNDVLNIRSRLTQGESTRSLSMAFNVSISTIKSIRSRHTWKNI